MTLHTPPPLNHIPFQTLFHKCALDFFLFFLFLSPARTCCYHLLCYWHCNELLTLPWHCFHSFPPPPLIFLPNSFYDARSTMHLFLLKLRWPVISTRLRPPTDYVKWKLLYGARHQTELQVRILHSFTFKLCGFIFRLPPTVLPPCLFFLLLLLLPLPPSRYFPSLFLSLSFFPSLSFPLFLSLLPSASLSLSNLCLQLCNCCPSVVLVWYDLPFYNPQPPPPSFTLFVCANPMLVCICVGAGVLACVHVPFLHASIGF